MRDRSDANALVRVAEALAARGGAEEDWAGAAELLERAREMALEAHREKTR